MPRNNPLDKPFVLLLSELPEKSLFQGVHLICNVVCLAFCTWGGKSDISVGFLSPEHSFLRSYPLLELKLIFWGDADAHPTLAVHGLVVPSWDLGIVARGPPTPKVQCCSATIFTFIAIGSMEAQISPTSSLT